MTKKRETSEAEARVNMGLNKLYHALHVSNARCAECGYEAKITFEDVDTGNGYVRKPSTDCPMCGGMMIERPNEDEIKQVSYTATKRDPGCL